MTRYGADNVFSEWSERAAFKRYQRDARLEIGIMTFVNGMFVE